MINVGCCENGLQVCLGKCCQFEQVRGFVEDMRGEEC